MPIFVSIYLLIFRCGYIFYILNSNVYMWCNQCWEPIYDNFWDEGCNQNKKYIKPLMFILRCKNFY